MQSFRLIITSLEGAKFDGDAESVTVPGVEGEMTLLAGHEPLVSALKPGIITAKKSGGSTEKIEIQKGVLECSHGQVTILV